MTDIFKITFVPAENDGRSVTRYVRLIKEGENRLYFTRLKKDGGTWWGRDGQTTEMIIWSKNNLSEMIPMKMNNFYGELEPLKGESK